VMDQPSTFTTSEKGHKLDPFPKHILPTEDAPKVLPVKGYFGEVSLSETHELVEKVRAALSPIELDPAVVEMS
ncbi:MAG: hypothetical protein AAGC74_14385, partial [Verrucomicrobiota bacterium]